MGDSTKRLTLIALAVVALASCSKDDARSREEEDNRDNSPDMMAEADQSAEGDASMEAMKDMAQEGMNNQSSGADMEPGEDMGDPPEEDMSSTAEDMGPIEPAEPIVLASAREVNANHMATADACSSCHSSDPSATAMYDEAGREVGYYDLWQASMMANASRDPFWRAMVAAEVEATPAIGAVIEDKCMTCHAPMGRASVAPEAAKMEDMLADTDAAQLGLDGVTCTSCHQIKPDNLGQPESFGGGYELALNGELYGPHAQPFERPMAMNSGFTPVQGDHMRESELCATCHTLTTDTFDPSGQPTGHSLPEQTPYVEWLNSAYATGQSEAASCQDCHVPRTSEDGAPLMTRIARRPGGGDFPPVSPRNAGRHLYVGGNTLIPQILRDNAMDLQPRADAAAFDQLIAAAEAQLRDQSATLEIEETEREGDELSITLEVESMVGHKFPTGFPSRRVWMRLIVKDASGATVFASGDYDAEGRLLDGGAVHAIEQAGGPTEPHRDEIDDDSQVLVYESIMAGTDGQPAWRLLRGSEYLKDNRLLPKGWSSTYVDIDQIAPVGPTEENFAGGQDAVTYHVMAPAGQGPYTIEAQLLYQPISARFAAELFAFGGDLPEVAIFRDYWRAADKAPALVAEAMAEAP